MLFDNFKKISLCRWNEYFKLLSNGSAEITSEGITLYPSHIIFMEFKGHYAMELVGIKRTPQSLRQRIAKYKSIYDYFDPFNGNKHKALFMLGGKERSDPSTPHEFRNILFSQKKDADAATARFKYLEGYKTQLIRINGEGSVFDFSLGFGSMVLQQCSILNHKEDLFRSKNIMFSAVIRKDVTNIEINKFFDVLFRIGISGTHTVAGVLTVPTENLPIVEVSLLQNLYISSGVIETTIDDFLASNPIFLNKIFSSNSVIYNATLKWLETDGKVKEVSIKPDVFVKREDGYYDIIDLKLAALSKRKLTKAKRSRRRFVDYVSEGLAQLANYEFYFSFAKNREHAKSHGIEIKNPQKTLVVGSMENIDPQEVIEALRAYDPSYSIIDYDTLVSRFLQNSTTPCRVSSF